MSCYWSVTLNEKSKPKRHRQLKAALKRAADYGVVYEEETGRFLQAFTMSDDSYCGFCFEKQAAKCNPGPATDEAIAKIKEALAERAAGA